MDNQKDTRFGKVTDKVIEMVFSEDKTKLYILILVIVGLILRIIAAINLSVSADDVHHALDAINIIKSGKLATWDQTVLWHYVTDIFYNLFRINQFSSRFSSVLFGTLTIPLMFLFTKEFFGKKAGLVSSFLLTFSPFHIKNTLAEMDVTTMFFVLLSVIIFINALRTDKKMRFIASGIFLGLGILTKVYSLLFIPALVIFALYKNYKGKGHVIDRENIKRIFIFLVTIFIFCAPILIHNYLLYKDKGIADFLFAKTFGLGKEKSAQLYSWAAGWYDKADLRGFFLGNSKILPWSKWPTSLYALGYILFTDPIIFFFGVIGLIYSFRKKREFFVLFMLIFLCAFPYLASMVFLSKHYLFLLIFLAPLASVPLSQINQAAKKNFGKPRLRHLLIPLLIFNLVFLGFRTQYDMPHFYSKSEVQSMMEYKKNIDKNSLVIADSRIYRGEIHWIFNGLDYVESNYFLQLQDYFKNSTENLIPTEIYFVECEKDDCGWGTIKDQPEFNESMEQFADFFKNNSKLEKEIYSAREQKFYFPLISKKEQGYFKVYKTRLLMNPAIIQSSKYAKSLFFYPIGYDESIKPIFDKYETHSLLDALLNKIAHWILYFSIFTSFLSIIVVFYLLYKSE